MSSKKLMIIDGNSLLHRAFYALPPLTTVDGLYTNGVYGFMTMFYRVTDEYRPDYITVVFDKKGPTFRHKEYEEYKAGRIKTPSELSVQFPILKEVLDALNIKRYELDGFEADDLAGTLTKLAEEKGLEVIALTGDKDYLQLASDKTKVLLTKKGISEMDVFDYDAVVDTYELTPTQFIDLKGLMGDKSDNIPGVPGVGEKTGIKLLKQYDTIDGIYENICLISGKLKEKLIEFRHQAFMSKTLATIITHIPLEVDIEEMRVCEPNKEELYNLYSKLEFKSFLDKIDHKDRLEKQENKVSLEYVLIEELIETETLLRDINSTKEFVMKTVYEDSPLKGEVIGMAIKCRSKNYFIDFKKVPLEDFLVKFKLIFEDSEIEKMSHNIKQDIIVLLRYDIDLKGISFDSMIGQYILNPSQGNYDLEVLVREYLKMNLPSEEDLLGKGKKKKQFSDIEKDVLIDFFIDKVDSIYKMMFTIKKLIEDQDMNELYYDVELPLTNVLADMEYRGFTVDEKELRALGEDFNKKIDELTLKIYEYSEVEFNINSPKQLGEILFNKLNLPVIKKTKTGYSTNAEVLEKLNDEHPIIEKILEYRQIVKLKSTYVDGLLNLIDPTTHKVHSSFNQTITTTGRISSTEPNLQNIPIRTEEGRKIRKVFIPSSDDYTLVDADYSQIELRVLAHIADDPKMKEAFFTGEDIHTKTASEVFNVPISEVTPLMRSNAKAVNFGIIYGISDFGLSRDLKIPKSEAKVYIDNYLENYVRVRDFMKNIVIEGKKKGYVDTILHRKRYLPELKSTNFNIRALGERLAMNTPIQGSAADIIKVAMVRVYCELKKLNLKSTLILQVHDELIIETHRDEVEQVKSLLKNLMETAVDLSVPLKVDMSVGDTWYDAK